MAKYTQQTNVGLDMLSQKALEVSKATREKQRYMGDLEGYTELSNFRQAYPQATLEQEDAHMAAFDLQRSQRNEGTLGDLGTDLAISFGDRVPQTFNALQGLFGDAIGSESISQSGWEGYAKQQAEAQESEKYYSDELRQAKANILAAAEERQAEQMADGEITTGEAFGEFFGTVGDYISNPLAALSEATKSSSDLALMGITGGIVGAGAKAVATKAATSAAKKRLGVEAAKRGISKKAIAAASAKAGSKAATKSGTITGIAYTGLSEGANNAGQVRDAIYGLDKETLMASDDYKALKEEAPDATYEEIRDTIAEEVARGTFVVSGALAAVIGKVTGAADKFGNIANKGTKKTKAGVIKSAVKGAGIEAIEETLQSGSGQLTGNVYESGANPDKQVLEGVGEAAGTGAVAGGLIGGTLSGSGRAVTKGLEKLDKAVVERNEEKIAKAITELQEAEQAQAEEAVAPEKGSETTSEPEEISEPKNVVEAYAPEREPAQEDEEVAHYKSQQVLNTYKDFEADAPEVQEFVDDVVSHTEGTDLSKDTLSKSANMDEVVTSLMTAVNTNQVLTDKAVELLSGDLSSKDAEAVTKLVTSFAPEKSVDAQYNTVAKVVNSFSAPETEQLVNSLIEKKTAEGQDADSAQVDALLETIGDVVLYSTDRAGQMSGETLGKLAEVTTDTQKKNLLNFVSVLKGNTDNLNEETASNIERVRKELLGSEGRGIGKHVQKFLEEIGRGDSRAAQETYARSIGYLKANQERKLEAAQTLKANPDLNEVEYSTGANTKRKVRRQGSIDAYINAVEGDLGALQYIDSLAQEVLYPSEKASTDQSPSQSVEGTNNGTSESPEGTTVDTTTDTDDFVEREVPVPENFADVQYAQYEAEYEETNASNRTAKLAELDAALEAAPESVSKRVYESVAYQQNKFTNGQIDALIRNLTKPETTSVTQVQVQGELDLPEPEAASVVTSAPTVTSEPVSTPVTTGSNRFTVLPDDDLLTVVAKSGGLSEEFVADTGIDVPTNPNKSLPLFPKANSTSANPNAPIDTTDGLLDLLVQHGFITETANGEVNTTDAEDAFELLMEAINDPQVKVYAPNSDAFLAQQEAEYQQQQIEQEEATANASFGSRTPEEVIQGILPETVLSGEALANPENVTAISEVTGIAEPVISAMPNEEVLNALLIEMDNRSKTAEGDTPYQQFSNTGLVSDANKSVWFGYSNVRKSGLPFVSSQEERTQEVLDAHSEALLAEAAQLDEQLTEESENASDDFSAMNDTLPEPVERPTGSVTEQKWTLNPRKVFASTLKKIGEFKKEAKRLAREFEQANANNKTLKHIIEAQAKLKKQREALLNQYRKAKEDFIAARDSYLTSERKRIKTEERKAAKVKTAQMAKAGKTPYDPQAATRNQYSRINAIAETVGVAKYNLDILAAVIGIDAAKLKEIVRGTGSTESIPKQIATEIRNNLGKNASKNVVENYIQETVDNLGLLVQSDTGIRGGKKRLGIKTYPLIKEAFEKKFPVDISTLPETHPARITVDNMVESSPLKTSLSSFKGSALWDMSSLLNLAPNDMQGMALFAEEHSLQLSEVAEMMGDYVRFKNAYINKLSKAIKSDRKRTELIKSMLVNEHNEATEHFIQTSFLAYAELMEYIGDNKYLPRKQLKSYIDKIDAGNTQLQAEFAGKGTFLPDTLVAGAVKRNTVLLEGYDQAQYLPALNTFLGSLVVNLVGETQGMTVTPVTHNNVRYIGYTRPKGVSGSRLLRGDNSMLKTVYGSKQDRTNHIGTPPNTDYSHLPEAAKEMAELTESVPFYMDIDKFEKMLEATWVEDDNGVMLQNETANNFVEKYLHEPSDAYIASLNKMDAVAQEGKKEGYKAEFLTAYKLYQRLKDEAANSESEHYNKPVPIYFSSHFSKNGRQFFDGEVNPQANKLHRILLRTSFGNEGIKQHGSLSNLLAEVNKNLTPSLKFYILAMGLGLGVKVDKFSNDLTFQQSLKALNQLDEDITRSEASSVSEFLTWKREEDADNYKQPSPEYVEALDAVFGGYAQKSLPIEVDGKTNGAFHSNWLYAMGALTQQEQGHDIVDLLGMGGLKDNINAADTHHDPITYDAYNNISSATTEEMLRMAYEGEISSDAQKAWHFLRDQVDFVIVDEVTGEESFTRNAPKAGVTSSVYGGSLQAISNGLVYGVKSGEGFLAKLYMDASAASSNQRTDEQVKQFYGWNAVFGEPASENNPKGIGIPLGLTPDQIKEYEITDAQLDKLKNHVQTTVGKAINTSINETFTGSKEVTNQVTEATGTMVALYNMAQRKLTEHVINKRKKQGKLPKGANLSKEDITGIKQALAGMFPEVALSIEGLSFLNQRGEGKYNTIQGTTIPALQTQDVKGNPLLKRNIPIDIGVASLKEAGVTATPNGIISVDAEMQRLTTKLMVALTDTLSLNVFDAQDIPSGSDTAYKALITNLAETITIMTADPVKNVADVLTGVLEASGKPLKFEGDIVVTNLQSLLTGGTEELTAEYVNFIQELNAELGGRLTVGIKGNLLAEGNIGKYLQDLNATLNQTAIQGELARLTYVAESEDGVKVQQLAGIDGTGILLNPDGSFAWGKIKEESGLSNEQIDAMKALPEVIEFEKGFKERIANRDAVTTAVPALDIPVESAKASDRTDMFSTLAGLLFPKGTFKKFKKEEGYTELVLTGDILKDIANKRINLNSEQGHLATTLYQQQGGGKTLNSSNLLGQKVRIVDKNSLSKFKLKGRNGMTRLEKTVKDEKDENGVIFEKTTYEQVIYIPEGLPIAEAIIATQHEFTHANLTGGILALSKGEGTPKQNALYQSMLADARMFSTYAEGQFAGSKTLTNLWLELQNLRERRDSGELTLERYEYTLVQEYVAYLNQNVNEGKVLGQFLTEDLTGDIPKEVRQTIKSIIKKLSDLLYSLIGSWINKDSIPKGADPKVTRIQLLQAFMAETATFKTRVVTRKRKESSTITSTTTTTTTSNVPLYSTDRINNQFTNRDYTEEQVTRLAELRDKAKKSIGDIYEAFRPIAEGDEAFVGKGAKEKKEYALVSKVIGNTKVTLDKLSAIGALEDGETEFLAQITGTLEIGRQKKYYQKRHLDKLYGEARKVIKPADLIPAHILSTDPSYNHHMFLAKELHDVLFNTNDDARVSRFAAFSEVSPELQAALKKIDITPQKSKQKNWFETIRHWIRDAIIRTGDRLSGIRPASADIQTQLIVDRMYKDAQLFDVKYEEKLAQYESKFNESIHFALSKGAQAIKFAIKKTTGKELSPDVTLRAAALDEILNVTPTKGGEPVGFWRSTMLEFLPRTAAHSAMIDKQVDRVKSSVDSEHKGIARGVKHNLENIFNKVLSREESAAIVDGEIKGDLQSLVQDHGYSMEELQKLLEDTTDREARINVAQNKILATIPTAAGKELRTRMINEAKALGYRMVQGGATKGMGLPNAQVISKLGTTGYITQESVDVELAQLLDELAALSAIQYMDSGTREHLASLYASDPEAMGKIHTQVRANLSDIETKYGSTIRMQKGATPDITDVNKSVRIVPKSQLGEYPTYSKLHEVKVPHSKEPHFVMYDEVGGAVPYVAGAISLIDSSLNQAAKGVVRSEGLSLWDAGDITVNNTKRYKDAMSNNILEPEALPNGGFVPNVNGLGEIVSYKYDLPRAEFKKLMLPTHDFADVLGDFAGRMKAEDVGKYYNKLLVQELHKDFSSKTEREKKAYVRVAKDSPYEQLRHAWELMPQDMKQEAEAYFGEKAIYVHRDDVNQAVGFREGSIKQMLTPENFDEKSYAKTVSYVLNKMIPPKVRSMLRKGELIAQEGTTMAKDLIVVKSGIVPAENLLSNINQLSLRGIATEDIYENILLGVNAKREYDAATEELYVLRAKIKSTTNPAEKAKLQGEFDALKQSREDNPLYRLIAEEGLNPTVIEELGEESKRDGLRKKMFERIQAKFEANLPKDSMFVDIGKEVIITQDSSVYKLLNEGLELGDFISKFVLYKELTEKEGVSHENAVEQARSEFINYNRNQNQLLDYLNKTGMMFFFKYFMRKHPILVNSIFRNPSRAIMQFITMAYLGAPSLFETNILNKDLTSATGMVDLADMALGAHPWLKI